MPHVPVPGVGKEECTLNWSMGPELAAPVDHFWPCAGRVWVLNAVRVYNGVT